MVIGIISLVAAATVLAVVAIGLYSLFIDDTIPAPAWLRATDVDGLKNKLAGIIAVMLGVLFLEKVITEADATDILPAGLGITAVIWALSYFIRSHPQGECREQPAPDLGIGRRQGCSTSLLALHRPSEPDGWPSGRWQRS